MINLLTFSPVAYANVIMRKAIKYQSVIVVFDKEGKPMTIEILDAV